MKTILITGVAGFLGSNLAEKLLQNNNIKIIGVDNFYTGQKSNIVRLNQYKNFLFMEHDIIMPIGIVEDIDEIYNLACPASPPHYQKDPIYTSKISVLGMLNIVELAQRKSAKLFFASTSEVYGDPLEHPQTEQYRGNVNCTGIRACYDEGKRMAESIIFDYYRKNRLPIKVARIFNTYGPYMDKNDGRVVSNFIIQALKNEDITIYGDGSQTRSFCYVDDLLEGFVKFMDSNDDITGPVNLGNPFEVTVGELANRVLTLLPESTSKVIHEQLPEDDPTRRRPNIDLAKKSLGWEPKIPIDSGLKKTIAYFKGEL